MSSETEFPHLVEQAKSGDEAALERLMLLYRAAVVAETRQFTDSLKADTSVQDVEQEVWLRVWTRLPTFHGSDNPSSCKAMFASWLQSTTRRVALGIIERGNAKKRGGQKRPDPLNHPVPGDDETPSHIARIGENKERLEVAIQHISDEQTLECVRLKFFEDMPVSEIAAKTGLTVYQVRYRLNTALQILANHLEEESHNSAED